MALLIVICSVAGPGICCVHLPVVSMLMLHREQAVAGGGGGGGGTFQITGFGSLMVMLLVMGLQNKLL